ncbi:uncharacterized protein BDZ99DRAFT_462376 [Mytilinidion resinicola]|uniref:Thioesterase domain-containing protein n=1 Tax=Mytilinidion resinicola TaxID=574789 RepID=A0A6A6YT60_9PEZI|nr:uncharacterized protein BDZ99DRAFT_462376 [Mytilinidion resinicola]KAF2811097.1 hypothetical protein BDZ99DRAFT_462376 [Mytilinidion resinicola]
MAEQAFSQHHASALHDYEVMRNMKLVDANGAGFVAFELEITEPYSNLNDVMHGGAAGVIFDMATTSALCPLARPGYWEFMGGVTRTLNLSYLKAVPIGTTVRLESKVLQVGRQMAMIQGKMTSLDGKVIYATVEHHKVNSPVKPEHRNARIPWDDEWDREHALKKSTKL